MRNTLVPMFLAAAAAGVFGLSPLTVSAEDAPEICPIVEPGETAAEFIGMWSLVSFDGEAPQAAFRVRLFTEGSAQVWLGDNDEPIAANCGTNCCGHLVLAPTEDGAFDPIVAEFEIADETLTLFATDGDWVFERVEVEAAD